MFFLTFRERDGSLIRALRPLCEKCVPHVLEVGMEIKNFWNFHVEHFLGECTIAKMVFLCIVPCGTLLIPNWPLPGLFFLFLMYFLLVITYLLSGYLPLVEVLMLLVFLPVRIFHMFHVEHLIKPRRYSEYYSTWNTVEKIIFHVEQEHLIFWSRVFWHDSPLQCLMLLKCHLSHFLYSP